VLIYQDTASSYNSFVNKNKMRRLHMFILNYLTYCYMFLSSISGCLLCACVQPHMIPLFLLGKHSANTVIRQSPCAFKYCICYSCAFMYMSGKNTFHFELKNILLCECNMSSAPICLLLFIYNWKKVVRF
jgi:hypothetical protein